jgi:hypothetical protein
MPCSVSSGYAISEFTVINNRFSFWEHQFFIVRLFDRQKEFKIFSQTFGEELEYVCDIPLFHAFQSHGNNLLHKVNWKLWLVVPR